MPKKLLVTGASGFLGWHVCNHARPNWQVFGTYSTHTVVIPDVTTIPLDLCDQQAMKSILDAVQPDAVIHCAAQSQPNWCEQHPEVSHAINVVAAANLAGHCWDRQIACVFTSSDQVFDGRHPPYREADPVCPINRYGEQKVAAENLMRDRHPDVRICRMPLMFGITPTAESFLQPFYNTLAAGKPLKLFIDEIRTPTSSQTAAQGLLLALSQSQLLLHLGGRERLSRFQFGEILARVAHFPPELLHACQQKDVPMAAPRPLDVSLDSQMAFCLGYQPLTIEQELRRLLTNNG